MKSKRLLLHYNEYFKRKKETRAYFYSKWPKYNLNPSKALPLVYTTNPVLKIVDYNKLSIKLLNAVGFHYVESFEYRSDGHKVKPNSQTIDSLAMYRIINGKYIFFILDPDFNLYNAYIKKTPTYTIINDFANVYMSGDNNVLISTETCDAYDSNLDFNTMQISEEYLFQQSLLYDIDIALWHEVSAILTRLNSIKFSTVAKIYVEFNT